MNVFDSKDGKIKPATLNNTDERAMNRYASGAPDERESDSLMPPGMTFRQGTHHAEKPYSFSPATRMMQRAGPSHGIRPAIAAGSKPMPADATKKFVQNLNGGKLRIIYIAVHGATIEGTNTVASNAIDDHNSNSTS